ncbi:brain acid soluble protein 1-like [Pezoporus flaviventris]|uniref:brain acid soluble protein 1-like n=1 Tax=Pezoporus flaviventris TaxID=889875 RepID=UPI002AB1924D|nr:brain acid soluble protein 1-like [Pezoporus flaviventris]
MGEEFRREGASPPAGVQRSPLRLSCRRAARSAPVRTEGRTRERSEPGEGVGRGAAQVLCSAPPDNFAGARRPPLPSPGQAGAAPGECRGAGEPRCGAAPAWPGSAGCPHRRTAAQSPPRAGAGQGGRSTVSAPALLSAAAALVERSALRPFLREPPRARRERGAGPEAAAPAAV